MTPTPQTDAVCVQNHLTPQERAFAYHQLAVKLEQQLAASRETVSIIHRAMDGRTLGEWKRENAELREESKRRHDDFCAETLRTSKLTIENTELREALVSLGNDHYTSPSAWPNHVRALAFPDPRLKSFSDPEVDHAQPPGDVTPPMKLIHPRA